MMSIKTEGYLRNMGSLPNLHELERVRRKLEDEQELAKREQRAREERESIRDREKLPVFLHAPQTPNPILPGNSSVGGGIASGTTILSTTHTTIGAGFGITTGNTHYGGYGILGYGTPGQIPKYHHYHHHHRHSLTTRHRVMRTRSSGASYNIWDDPMIEHMAAYSPISSRSHRIMAVPPYQVQAALAASRRRESINSSIGANSIRRLLTLTNHRNCRHKIPTHVHKKICKSFTFLAISHGLICAMLWPLIALQGSNSIWHHREQWIHVGPNIGSMLLSISFLISCGMCFLTTRLIRKIGYMILLVTSYIVICIFLLCHLYPSIYTLVPAYILFGIILGPSWISKMSLVVHFANKLSCYQTECSYSNTVDSSDPDSRISCNRDQKVRRLARWFQAAQDIGIIIGAVIASIALKCSATDSTCFGFRTYQEQKITTSLEVLIEDHNRTAVTFEDILRTTSGLVTQVPNDLTQDTTLMNPYLKFLPSNIYYIYDMYNHNEHGERICGADMCPIWHITEEQASNGTFYASFIHEGVKIGGISLIIIYLLFTLISLALTVLSGKIENMSRHENIKGMTDTLLFAAPLAYFIGTEQGYMLGDFTRAYVSCTLGLQMVAGALIGMGIMQAIVACTLSMLLRHISRIIVILAGFFFHACLLLVLSQWKPSNDDSALFYVIAASWGACNAMWETLLFALITLTHHNNVAEVIAPLQALRFLGLGITFAAHGFLCENPKILLLVIILVVSLPPYAILEIRLEAQRKSQLIAL